MDRLAPYAVTTHQSRGRRVYEVPDSDRSEYQRDRDRIIHSTSFRRLEYKTQVFVNHEGDLFRTRLTHSIEVAQIARSLARSLKANEDLVEAICLAHDLGHTPFGHSGQDALNLCMRKFGGFEHNLQSLRVVDILERRYAAFDGLNLCYETREGILKRCSKNNARNLGEIGERFLFGLRPSLEAQIANLADEIAYNNHDVDDGLRSGLITVEELRSVKLFNRFFEEVVDCHPELEGRRVIYETVRRIINVLVKDLVCETSKRIQSLKPQNVEDVRKGPPLVSFSREISLEHQELKQFLRKHLYKHKQVVKIARKSKVIISELFQLFNVEPTLIPRSFLDKGNEDLRRSIADYIAGMTDRFAFAQYRKYCSDQSASAEIYFN